MSKHCPSCDILFPLGTKECPICGESLRDSVQPVDKDWQEKVTQFKIDAAGVDKVIRWRFGQLLRAGMPPRQAEEIAYNREIDLHRAVEITEKAGYARALEILL